MYHTKHSVHWRICNNIPPPPCITPRTLSTGVSAWFFQNLFDSNTYPISYIIWPKKFWKATWRECMSKNSAKNQPNTAGFYISIVTTAVIGKWPDTPVGDEEDALRWRPRVIEYNFVAVRITIFSNKYFPLIWVCPEHRHCTDIMLFPGYL